jgi:hypothetical protein
VSLYLECAAELRKVGQGCFYTAIIEPEHGEPFAFVYDCGSDTKGNALKTEIETFLRSLGSRGLDMLTLSHLDADHVNGLDLLLVSARTTKVAFLPYFTPAERLLCALRFPNEAENSYYEFLADPVQFLLSRGVESVVFIGPGEGGEPPPLEAPPEVSPDDDEAGPPKLDIWNLPNDNRTRAAFLGENQTYASSPDILFKTDRQTVKLFSLWRFRFFHKEENLRDEITRLIGKPAPRAALETDPVAKRAAAFLDTVETVQKQQANSLAPMELVEAIRDKKTRKAIKKAYQGTIALQNDVSLVMWHGPERISEFSYRSEVFGSRPSADWEPWQHSLRRQRKAARNTTGTMLTGDLNLRNQRTKAALLQHYTLSLPETAFLYLPHHGSHENWKADASILASNPICIVSAGLRSKHGHPHVDVVEELEDEYHLPVYRSHERSAVTLRVRCYNAPPTLQQMLLDLNK